MVRVINGQLVFCYESLEKPKTKLNSRLYSSLLGILVGIFLLPNIAYFSDITASSIIELTNQQRVKAGINILNENELLTKAAYAKANYLLEKQIFAHNIEDIKFSSWVKDAGYNYSFVGENLAVDFLSGEGIVRAWLDSPSHRKNLLDSEFQEIGIAALEGNFQGRDTIIVVQIFGTPATAISQPKVLGINAENYLTYNNVGFLSNENLLTHAISGGSLPPASTNKLTISSSHINKTQPIKKIMDNSYFSTIITYLVMFISILLILSICFIYQYLFSGLMKLSHHY